MYFIIAPDCPSIFPSGVMRNGICPSGDLPAKINEVKKKKVIPLKIMYSGTLLI